MGSTTVRSSSLFLSSKIVYTDYSSIRDKIMNKFNPTGSQDPHSNEINVMKYLSKVWECQVTKMPDLYQLDFMIFKNNKPVAVAEYKRRFINREDYGTTMLPLNKYMKALEFNSMLGLKAFYIVEYNNGLYYTDITQKPQYIQYDGRKDRKLVADRQPMAFYPVSELKQL